MLSRIHVYAASLGLLDGSFRHCKLCHLRMRMWRQGNWYLTTPAGRVTPEGRR